MSGSIASKAGGVKNDDSGRRDPLLAHLLTKAAPPKEKFRTDAEFNAWLASYRELHAIVGAKLDLLQRAADGASSDGLFQFTPPDAEGFAYAKARFSITLDPAGDMFHDCASVLRDLSERFTRIADAIEQAAAAQSAAAVAVQGGAA